MNKKLKFENLNQSKIFEESKMEYEDLKGKLLDEFMKMKKKLQKEIADWMKRYQNKLEEETTWKTNLHEIEKKLKHYEKKIVRKYFVSKETNTEENETVLVESKETNTEEISEKQENIFHVQSNQVDFENTNFDLNSQTTEENPINEISILEHKNENNNPVRSNESDVTTSTKYKNDTEIPMPENKKFDLNSQTTEEKNINGNSITKHKNKKKNKMKKNQNKNDDKVEENDQSKNIEEKLELYLFKSENTKITNHLNEIQAALNKEKLGTDDLRKILEKSKLVEKDVMHITKEDISLSFYLQRESILKYIDRNHDISENFVDLMAFVSKDTKKKIINGFFREATGNFIDKINISSDQIFFQSGFFLFFKNSIKKGFSFQMHKTTYLLL